MFSRKHSGFTLIEMLVVIAIIAVLAAIMFPVMASIKRQAKKSQCTSNMRQIFTAMKLFQLEEHRYPDFIAGPVEYEADLTTVVPLDKVTGSLDNMTAMYHDRAFSLYPQYITSVNDLRCPLAPKATLDSIVKDPMWDVLKAQQWNPPDDTKANKPVRAIGWKSGGGQESPFYLYKASSYDWQAPPGSGPIGPCLTGDEAHYSTVWSAWLADSNVQGIERQMKWRNPPSETIITWCGYHRDMVGGSIAQNSMDLVLFLDGHTALKPSRYFSSVDSNAWYLAWQNVTPTSK